MRFIKKDFANITAREKLESNAYNSDVDSSVLTRKGTYQSSRYGHEVIRDELEDLYFGKCCYCETVIKPVSTEHVEHFRPKAKITGVNDNGYYWLGYEWSNLLLACPSCNGAKGTKFPLNNNNHVIDHPVDVNGDFDRSMLPNDQNYLNVEWPLLINPEYWKPESLMYIDYFGKLVPIKDNLLAKTTIKEIGLNRDSLIISRQSEIDKIVIKIEEQLFAKYGDMPLTDEQFKFQLSLIFKEIVSRINPTSEYTLLGKCMIERFDELILEDIEIEFHDEIRNYFIEFINDI